MGVGGAEEVFQLLRVVALCVDGGLLRLDECQQVLPLGAAPGPGLLPAEFLEVLVDGFDLADDLSEFVVLGLDEFCEFLDGVVLPELYLYDLLLDEGVAEEEDGVGVRLVVGGLHRLLSVLLVHRSLPLLQRVQAVGSGDVESTVVALGGVFGAGLGLDGAFQHVDLRPETVVVGLFLAQLLFEEACGFVVGVAFDFELGRAGETSMLSS